MAGKSTPYILWLPSWYPNPVSPYNGDFIQRHAKAVAALMPVTVIYFAQFGVDEKKANKNEMLITDSGPLKEVIVYFTFFKTGIALIDKIIYNIRYRATFKKFMREHFQKSGMPALVHVHVPMKAGIVARWIKKHWNIPYIVSEQSSHYVNDGPGGFETKSNWHKQMVKGILNEAAYVTSVSKTVLKVMNQIASPRQHAVVHNAVDVDVFNYRHHDLMEKFRFLHVSSMHSQQKNPEGIIMAAIALRNMRTDFELVFVGPAREDLQLLAREHHAEDYISFAGELTYEKVAMEMQKAHAFVLFSRHENFPCVIVEALCCGLPVITSVVGGTAEAVNETNGILVTSEQVDELKQAMNDMVDRYHHYDRNSIAANAIAKYNYQKIGNDFYDIYKQLLP